MGREGAVAGRPSNDEDVGELGQPVIVCILVNATVLIARRPDEQDTCFLGFLQRGFDGTFGIANRVDGACDHFGTVPDGIPDCLWERCLQVGVILAFEFGVSADAQIHDLDVSADPACPEPIVRYGAHQAGQRGTVVNFLGELPAAAANRVIVCISEVPTMQVVDVSVAIVVLAVEGLSLVLPDVRFEVRVGVVQSEIE